MVIPKWRDPDYYLLLISFPFWVVGRLLFRPRFWQFLIDIAYQTGNDQLFVFAMRHVTRCQGCDQIASAAWCAACLEDITSAILLLRDSADLAVVVCVLKDAGAGRLAGVCVGVVPFTDAPPYDRMMQ